VTIRNASPWILSGSMHAIVAAPFLIAVFLIPNFRTQTERVPMKIFEIEKPAAVSEQPKSVRISDAKPPVIVKKSAPPVFGLSKNTLQAESGSIEIKAGNTVAKEVDNVRAENEDPLPVPTDEYLVSSMPRLLKEIRAAYPEAARTAKIEGPVVMDVLIDTNGNVVDVKVISGLGFGLDEAAAEAMKLFKFEPARVQDQKVAVRIRYTYRFELRS
jgi:periplasmic protein TonB